TAEAYPSTGRFAVADARGAITTSACFALADDPNRHRHVLGVNAWDPPVETVTGQGKPSSGAFSVASPLIPQAGTAGLHDGKYARPGGGPAKTVTTASRVGSGAQAVADVRVKGFRGAYGVLAQDEPACTVTGNGRPAAGPFAWAAPAPRPSVVMAE